MITVVIPAYNCAETIDRALRSIEAQTLPAAEIIVVDDGSTDATPDLLAGWERAGRLRSFRQANSGIAQVRNRGASIARSRWISFLDADDEILPETLAEVWATVTRCPEARWLMCDVVRVRPSGEERQICTPPREISDWLPAILERNFVERGILFEREMLIAAGGFDESFRIFEDWDFYIRLIRAGVRPAHVPRALYRYIETSGSITRDTRLMVSSLKQVLQRQHRPLADTGDPTLRRIYANWLWRLARDYYYKLRERPAAIGCLAQSLLYDFDLGRVISAVRTHTT